MVSPSAELDSLSGALLHAYEELHLLYSVGEALTGELGVAEVAELILGHLLESLEATHAEIRLAGSYGRTFGRTESPDPACRPPTSERHRLDTELWSVGQFVGHIVLERPDRRPPFSSGDAKLLAAVGTMVASAIRNAQLHEAVRSQTEELRERERRLKVVVSQLLEAEEEERVLAALSARQMQLQEEERRRLALELHDDPLQRALLLARELGEDAGCEMARRWRTAIDDIVVTLRGICVGLRPPMLDDLGLTAALEWLVNDVRARSDLEVALRVAPEGGEAAERLAPGLEIALFRIAQEALNNTLKHAHATQVAVSLERSATGVRLQVTDNGHGLSQSPGEAGRTATLGLRGMRERLAGWSGRVVVENGSHGGTVVLAEVEEGRR